MNVGIGSVCDFCHSQRLCYSPLTDADAIQKMNTILKIDDSKNAA